MKYQDMLDVLARIKRFAPQHAALCDELAEHVQHDSEKPVSMPPETLRDQVPSATGWYWRPHPDKLLRHTAVVFVCEKHAPKFGSRQYRAESYRPAAASELEHGPVCHYCPPAAS